MRVTVADEELTIDSVTPAPRGFLVRCHGTVTTSFRLESTTICAAWTDDDVVYGTLNRGLGGDVNPGDMLECELEFIISQPAS